MVAAAAFGLVYGLPFLGLILGMALGQIFIGPISDSRGRRGPLLLTLVFFTLASFFCAQTSSGQGFIALANMVS